MINLLLGVLGLMIASFIFGVLFGRKNPKKVEKAVAEAKTIGGDVKDVADKIRAKL
jgi:hypothetical protein